MRQGLAFVCAGRRDLATAHAFGIELALSGWKVWLDREQAGGPQWWDEIVTTIRACDCFVFVVSESSLRSSACRDQLEYADRLQRPIVAAVLEPRSPDAWTPSPLDRATFLESGSAGELTAVLSALPSPPALPDPLPVPPPPPIHYLRHLWSWSDREDLSPTEQLRLIDDIVDCGDAEVVDELLERLRENPNITQEALAAIGLVSAKPLSVGSQQGGRETTPSKANAPVTQPRRPTTNTPYSSDVEVSVYQPALSTGGGWAVMPVFVHRASVADDVVARAALLLGAQVDQYQAHLAPTRRSVRHGSDVTIEAWVQGGECRPPQVKLRWLPPLVETVFEVRYLGTQPVASGGLRVFTEGVVVAEVALSLPVSSSDEDARRPRDHARVDGVRRNRQVFASYSRKDRSIVRLLSSAGRALGDDYIIDSDALRAGERWEERVDEMIRQADAFELFWSTHSMRSPHVRHEWELALALKRHNFIKPVYWQDPRPEDPPLLPPPELDELHFSKLEVTSRRLRSLLRRP